MAIRQCALVAALLPAIAFAANTTVANTTAVAAKWSASTAVATLLAKEAEIAGNVATQAGAAAGTKLAGLTITALTCNASGPAASGTIAFTLTSSAAALADSQFPRWIAKGIAVTMGADQSQVEVFLKAARRLTTDAAGRRLSNAVAGTFNVFNPNRGRNIGLGIGLGVVAPALGLGLGLGLTRNREVTTTPAPIIPTAIVASVAPYTPVPVMTVAPEESGSSMPLWMGILLALAVLACIGAAIAMMMKGDKKKKPKKKAAPVKQEAVVYQEEFVPMLAPAPVYQSVQTFQPPVPAPVFTSYAAPQFAAPQMEYVQAAPQYAAPGYAQPFAQPRMF